MRLAGLINQFHQPASAVVSVPAVTRRALVGEDPGTSRERIFGQQTARSFDGNHHRTVGQFFDSRTVAVDFGEGGLVVVVRAVFVEGESGQQDDARHDGPRVGDVEFVAGLPLRDEWHRDEDSEQQTRDVEGTSSRSHRSDQFDLDEAKQEQKVPFGPGGLERLGRIGGRIQLGAFKNSKQHHDCQDAQTGDSIFKNLVRPETRFGRSLRSFRVDAVTPEHVDVQNEKPNQQAWQNAGVHREEPRQCVMSVLFAALSQLLNLLTDDRRDAHDVCRHFGRVITLLVPRQQVSGQAEGQDDLHQDQTQPEVNLTRRLIRSVNNHLNQVNRQQHDHCLSSEVMDASHQIAKEHLFLDVVNAFPGRLSTRAVGRPQENTRDDLNGKREDKRAAPDVPPA